MKCNYCPILFPNFDARNHVLAMQCHLWYCEKCCAVAHRQATSAKDNKEALLGLTIPVSWRGGGVGDGTERGGSWQGSEPLGGMSGRAQGRSPEKWGW